MDVSDTNVKVFCRLRPPNERERGVISSSSSSTSTDLLSRIHASTSFVKKCVTVPASDTMQQTVFLQSKHCPAKTFTFDRVFDEDATQNDVFEVVGAPITRTCLEGYNGTIFAYGQTGSGKTFTMQGPDDVIDTEAQTFTQEQLALRGLVPRVFDYLFDNVVATDSRKNVQHTFACSFLEIYNERVYDLLDRRSTKDAAGLQLRESGRKGVHVEGLIESVVVNSKRAAELMTIGAQNRRVGQTSMNRESSRSHSVFILQLQSKEKTAEGMKIRTSRFNLVDLAGSERQRSTDAAGERLKEAGSINKSLSALGNVILGLSEQSVGKHRHVHYRDSKLTFLLKDSLGGNSKTFMVATISPAEDSAFETLSTLKFAQRAKMIQNSAVVNEDAIGSTLFLQEEVQRLRRNLQQAHIEIARYFPGSKLLQQGVMPSESTSSQNLLQQRESCVPTIDARFRELEEAFAASAESNERLQRSCEYLQLQNGNVHALCAEMKQNIAHLRLMLRLRGIDGPGVRDYKPSADAIEWRIKYEEMEERVVELEEILQRNESQGDSVTGKTINEVENLNMMLLGLTRQLAAVLRDKHDLQDRLLDNQSKKDESEGGSSLQEAMDTDFSARLEEALKQQATEYQAKLDSVASFNACLEKQAIETALELQKIKQREASWSIQQLDFENRAADSHAAMLEVEKAHQSSLDRLVQEQSKVEELEVQLERTREGIRLEFEAALADASTANKELKDAKKLLQQKIVTLTAKFTQREQEAALTLNDLKTEMFQLEAANKKKELQLNEARDGIDEASRLALRLKTDVSDRDKLILELKRTETVILEKSRMLEQELTESSNVVRQLQEDAAATAQSHVEAIKAARCQAEEQEQKLIQDFETRLVVKDEQLEQLHAKLNDANTKAEEAAHCHSLVLEKSKAAFLSLQRQFDEQQQQSKIALIDAERKLVDALADVSTLSEEKCEIDVKLTVAMQQIDGLQNGMKSIEREKSAMASEIQSLTEQTEQLKAERNRQKEKNAELQKKCDQQQAQLSQLKETITRFTREVEELQQQITTRSNEVAELCKDLASAQEQICKASSTVAEQATKLSNSTAKIQELEQEVAVKKDFTDELTNKLEKAVRDIRDAENNALHQQEELKMYQETQCKLRDELKTLEFKRLELAESLKMEQESKQDVEKSFASARKAWSVEKNQLSNQSQDAILALEERIDELAHTRVTLLARSHELEQENETFKTTIVEKDKDVAHLMDRVANKEAEIRALETCRADSATTLEKFTVTVAELRSSVCDLEGQLTEQQHALSQKEKELTNTQITVAERDHLIASLQKQALDDEAAWGQMTCEYKAKLETSRGRVQALEQLVAEKTVLFDKAERVLMTENDALKRKLEESEDSFAQQTAQLMQEIKHNEEKDAALELAHKSVVELNETLTCSTKDASSAKVQELQKALEELQMSHQVVVAENAKLKAHEKERERRQSELDTAEERNRSVQKALDAQQAVVESALQEAKTKAASQEVLEQAKRKFLTKKVKLQRELQSLTKKLETVMKENEKLVGHHNSRQKIQHHAKVKEENNRLLQQVRQLSDDKFKLQRTLGKVQLMLKEKENIGLESSRNKSPASPASSALCKSQECTPHVQQPSFKSATAGLIGKIARSRPTSRSASPRPSRKRMRTPTEPGWQR